MENIIVTENLFGAGSGRKFRDAIRNVSLADVPFLQEKTVIQVDHCNGAPNNSFASTADGAMQAVYALSGGRNVEHVNFPLFGNHMRESLDTIKAFYKTFLKK